MRRWIWLVGVLWLSGCNDRVVTPVPPSVGSETHWLERCPLEGCGDEALCVCGVCTNYCESDEVCGGGVCVDRVAQCAGDPICVAPCDGGCGEGLRCVNDACVAPPTVARRTTPLTQQVDFLFVVDNSGSMCEEQDALAQAIEEITPSLDGLDWRAAVVSTDLEAVSDQGRFLARPTPPVRPPNCGLIPNTADCPDDLAPVLREGLYDAAENARRLRCMVSLGTDGYGFEKGLEAMREALSCAGPNARRFAPCCVDGAYDPACAVGAEFLRPHAGLVVVIVSDEDDCSSHWDAGANGSKESCRADPEGFSEADYGALLITEGACVSGSDPRQCYAQICGGTVRECWATRCTVDESINYNCAWHPEVLTPVADYAAFLRRLKVDPQSIAYWPFNGRPILAGGVPVQFSSDSPLAPECDPQDEAYAPSTDLCCDAEGHCPTAPWTSCHSAALGDAFAGHRYMALGALLGAQTCTAEDGCSLCAAEISLRDQMARRLPRAGSAQCLPEAPPCVNGPCQGDESSADVLGVSVLVNEVPVGVDGWSPRWGLAPSCPFAVVLHEALPPGARLWVQLDRQQQTQLNPG